MFAINDCVFYCNTGVCRIVDVKSQKVGGSEAKECYVLKPIFNSSSIIYVPIDHDELLNNMRPVMTKDEIHRLIQDVPGEESVWIDNERERGKDYLTRLRSCSSRELMKLIKVLYEEKLRKKGIGKCLSSTDTKIMVTAEKLLYEEFAFVLGIDTKAVVPYILEHIHEGVRS